LRTERNMWHHTSKTAQTASWKKDSTPQKKIFLHGNLECATNFENSTMATKTAVSSLLDDIHVSGDRGYLRIKRAGGKFTRIKTREWTRCRESGPRIHVGNIPRQQLFIIKSLQVPNKLSNWKQSVSLSGGAESSFLIWNYAALFPMCTESIRVASNGAWLGVISSLAVHESSTITSRHPAARSNSRSKSPFSKKNFPWNGLDAY
jgi:hypothetical protein